MRETTPDRSEADRRVVQRHADHHHDAPPPVVAQPEMLMRLQRAAGNGAVAQLMGDQEESSPVLDVVGKGGGQSLEPSVQRDMEGRLGSSFSDVKVHTDPAASASAAAVDASAYTVGNEIVFGAGSYQPDTPEGRHTLAHELTHVVQQRSGPVSGTDTGTGVAISDPSDSFEQAAEASADAALRDDDHDH